MNLLNTYRGSDTVENLFSPFSVKLPKIMRYAL